MMMVDGYASVGEQVIEHIEKTHGSDYVHNTVASHATLSSSVARYVGNPSSKVRAASISAVAKPSVNRS
jgi:hypothetical protein